jgi:hypothetical protein
MDQAALMNAGAPSLKQTKYVPMGTKRFFTGLYTSRSPLQEPGTRAEAKFYNGRPDALWAGLNVEVSANNTLIRRPGFSLFQTMPVAPTSLYTLRSPLAANQIISDSTTAVYNASTTPPTAIFTKAAGSGQTFFQSVGVWMFMSDGIDLLKWDGTHLWNWGITPPVSAPSLAFATGTYNITSSIGVSYVYCFQNDYTAHPSTASPVSASTGPMANTQITLTGTGSIDPQVSNIQIYRTVDGGASYLLLATIANPGAGTWTYVDIGIADLQLNELIQAPQAMSNNPPPAGLTNLTFFGGCIYGSIGNYLHYSNGSNTTNGSGNEAWPPLNFSMLPSKITRLVAYPNGLLIFTVDDLYYVSAPGATPSIYQAGLGTPSYNSVCVSGSVIYVFTTDCNVLALNPGAGIVDLGFGIADQFVSVSGANVSLAYQIMGHNDNALFVLDGATGNFWRCNPNQQPEGGAVWSTRATIAAGATLLAAMEPVMGTHRLMVASGNNILYRDWTVSTDNGTSYDAWAVIGSIVLALPGQLCELESATIESILIGTQPSLSVLLGEISGTFEDLPDSVNDPPELVVPSSSLYSNRYYLNQSTQPVVCRHLQLKVGFGSDSFRNELLSYSLYGALHSS